MSEQNPVRCKRCGEQWQPHKENPRYCPRCKSPLWNKDYVRNRKKKTVEQVADSAPRGFAVGPELTYEERVALAMERLKR